MRLLRKSVLCLLLILGTGSLRAQSEDHAETVAYDGSRISLSQNYFSCRRLASLRGVKGNSYQGMDIWNHQVVSLQNRGFITLYSLSDNDELIRTKQFRLSTADPTNHANVASFGTKFFQEGDPMPLLYVTRCHKAFLNGMDKLCFVERVLPEKDTTELVQTIWLRDKDHALYGVSTQFVVDRQQGYLYAYGNTIGNREKKNKHRIMKFRLPAISEGSLVVLTAADALENYLMEDYCSTPITPMVIQGATIYNNLLYLPVGLGTEKDPSYILVWNLATKRMQTRLDLRKASRGELEDCTVFNERLYVQTQGSFYVVDFDH